MSVKEPAGTVVPMTYEDLLAYDFHSKNVMYSTIEDMDTFIARAERLILDYKLSYQKIDRETEEANAARFEYRRVLNYASEIVIREMLKIAKRKMENEFRE